MFSFASFCTITCKIKHCLISLMLVCFVLFSHKKSTVLSTIPFNHCLAEPGLIIFENTVDPGQLASDEALHCFPLCIAPDKAAYCVFTQFCERENAIKFISVHTKTQ